MLLTGEPGIGKTRLVQESRKRFIAWVGAGSGSRPLWLEGRGVSYASATPYGLYRQLLAGWLGVALDQPPAMLRSALADALTRLMGNTNLLSPLAHLMGLPQTQTAPDRPTSPDRPTAPDRPGGRAGPAPEELQRQAFGAMRALVSRFAAVGPTVLVLEDLHWADPTSLRLTTELAELARGRALLVLGTSRPGAGPAGPAIPAPPDREIRLRRLGTDAAQALAQSLIGQVRDPDVLAAVLANADGNPLFLEERLAEMLETGALVREQGAWRLRRPPGSAEPQVLLPQVLERLIRSRVDRLGPAAAEAIRAAAVLGTRFTTELLASALGREPAALTPVLTELCASDLVHSESPGGLGPAFLFRHALIQEATYLGLLRADRRDLHARAARALEVAAAGRLPEVAAIIGRHYARAEDAGRAVHYLELAGDHATDAFANDEAVSLFREALAVAELAGQGSGTLAAAAVRLHARLANVLWRTARHDEATDAFHAALRLAGAGSRPLDPVLRAHLHIRLGRLELTGMQYAEAAADFDAAEALLAFDASDQAGGEAAAGDVADQWLELMVDGRADLHVMRFQPDLALAALERARPVLTARGTPARKTAFYRIHTMQRLLRNRLRVDEQDIGNLRAAVAAAKHSEDRDKDVGYATSFLGWALWLRGDLAAADEELTKALRLAERIGETHLRDMSLLFLSLTALRRHDVERVRGLLPQVFAAAGARPEDSRAASRVTGGWACVAWLAWQDGCPDEVSRLAAEIERLDLSALGSGAMYRWVYLFPLIAMHVRAGETAAAAAAARRIIDPAQQQLPDDLTAALAAASQAQERGSPAETTRLLTEALALARAHGFF